jgi:hypothetical protein
MSRFTSVSLVLGIVLLGFVLVRNPSQAQAPQQRIAWEYTSSYNQGVNQLDTTQIDQLGLDGWELVTIYEAGNGTSHFVLKRPK